MSSKPMEKIISFDSKIEELPLFLGDHENEISKRVDSLSLDKPIFLIRQNMSTLDFEGLKVTEKILNFLKENKDKDLDYDLYINYTLKSVYTTTEKLKENEEFLYYEEIDEDEFIKSEMKFWKSVENISEEDKERANSILDAIKDFHNQKWHNGEKFWK